MKKIITGLCVFLFCVPVIMPSTVFATNGNKHTYSIVEQSVTFQSNENTLYGELTRPNTKQKVPVVIFLHGLTVGRDEYDGLFSDMAAILAKAGIASLRFDFTGVGDSEGKFQDTSILTEVEDAKQALLYVQSLPFIDTEQISVLGMSMGGAVASLFAAEHQDELYRLCLWAPAGRLVYDARYNWFDFLTGGDPHKIVTLWNGYSLSSAFVEDIKQLDFFSIASEYKKDALLLYGEYDLVMWGGYVESYQQAYPHMDIEMIPDCGHFFDEPAKKHLYRQTLDFFQKTT